jgi:hypothetical protein
LADSSLIRSLAVVVNSAIPSISKIMETKAQPQYE